MSNSDSLKREFDYAFPHFEEEPTASDSALQDPKVKQIYDLLETHGIVDIRILKPYETLTGGKDKVTDVHCVPGVFPTFSSEKNPPDMTTVLVNNNFRMISNHFLTRFSAEATDPSTQIEPAIAEATGPPGSGKTTIGYFIMTYLAQTFDKAVVYVSLKTAGGASATVLAVFVKNFVITVTFIIGEKSRKVIDTLRNAGLVDGLFLDGFYRDDRVEEEWKQFATRNVDVSVLAIHKNTKIRRDIVSTQAHLGELTEYKHNLKNKTEFDEEKKQGLWNRAEDAIAIATKTLESLQAQKQENGYFKFLGATTSMDCPCYGNFLDRKVSITSNAWEMVDYERTILLEYELHNKVSDARLLNLGCNSGESDVNKIVNAMREKFLVAGHSCRFMFDYTTERVIRTLRSACENVTSLTTFENFLRAVNILVVKRVVDANRQAQELVPVSLAAEVLMNELCLLDQHNNKHITYILRCAESQQPPVLGWLFEMETLDRLKKSFCLQEERDNVGKCLQRMLRKWSPIVLSQSIPFELKKMTDKKTFPIPAKGAVLEFTDVDDLVQIIRNHGWNSGALWLIPKYYANPFFDFALVEYDDTNQILRMKTFQITIAATHSCDALIVQFIYRQLKDSTPGSRFKDLQVTHHAVVPNAHCAGKFKFTEIQNMEPADRVLHSHTNSVASSVAVKLVDHIEPEEFNEERPAVNLGLYEKYEEGTALPLTTEKDKWTTVRQGEHLFLNRATYFADIDVAL